VIERVKDRLVDEHAMTSDLAERVDADRILAFFQSDLGRLVLDKTNRILREWPFTYAQPIPEPARASGEFIVVQGVIDMLVQTPRGLIVIDYKTDRIGRNDLAARAEVYRGQVDLYAKAAAAILRDKVLARWLYFLSLRQAVQL
jgi:ATP-dependent helicase/nuclease subunit A